MSKERGCMQKWWRLTEREQHTLFSEVFRPPRIWWSGSSVWLASRSGTNTTACIQLRWSILCFWARTRATGMFARSTTSAVKQNIFLHDLSFCHNVCVVGLEYHYLWSRFNVLHGIIYLTASFYIPMHAIIGGPVCYPCRRQPVF